jgi:hypothetical protein
LDAIRFSVGVFGASIDALSDPAVALASVAADVAFFAFFAFFAPRVALARRQRRTEEAETARVRGSPRGPRRGGVREGARDFFARRKKRERRSFARARRSFGFGVAALGVDGGGRRGRPRVESE